MMEKTNIKGERQVMGQGAQFEGVFPKQQTQPLGEGKRKRRQRRRRRNQQKKEGGEQQTLGDKVAQKGGEIAEQAGAKLEGNKIDSEKVEQKGKDWAEKAGEFIDEKMPESLKAKEGEQSWGEKIAEKGKEWSEKASSMIGDKTIDSEKLEEKGKELSEKAGEYIDEKKPKMEDNDSTENLEEYTTFGAVKSLASDVVEQAGHTLGDIKDAAFSTLGFDTAASSREERIDEEQKDVEESFGEMKEGDGEGILETAKEMIFNAFETVKEKAGDAIEAVSEAATDIGLTLEPGLAPDTYSDGDYSLKEKKFSGEKIDEGGFSSGVGDALAKMDSVQPI